MCTLPRLALGTIQPLTDPRPIVWALLESLQQDGLRTQTFLSRACFRPYDVTAAISGNTPRHLDSWLMSSDMCRSLFWRAGSTADLAIVEGQFRQTWCDHRAPDHVDSATNSGGNLDTLSQWLDLPRVAIVDVAALSNCHLPVRPAVDALLLDRMASTTDFHRWQTILESVWGLPVVGGLNDCANLRQNIADLPVGQKPLRQWCSELSQQFLQHSSLKRILALAARRSMTVEWSATTSDASPSLPRTNARVAVAYDDAFHCYFPDVLDMLESYGASVRVFSPLRDECLPPETDIVYLGCGSPHEHAEALAANHCLVTAIKKHVCSGRRVYAEGGGLAYLCQHVETADGRRCPMVGALRAIARRNLQRQAPQPAEITLAIDTWLGPAGTTLRGYRNCNWILEPTGNLTRFARETEAELDLVGRHQAIGSRIHFNFAAQPKLLGGFLRSCPAALAWSAR